MRPGGGLGRRSSARTFHIHVPRPRFRHLVHGDFYLDLDGGQATGGVRTWCGQASSRFCVWDPSYHTAPDHVSVHMVSVVLEMCSRCTSTPLPAHTPVRHRRHTDERSDCKAIPFLTSHVHGHVLHSNGWLVVSPRPPPYAASACPPARSQSHVMFHHSARVDEATISKSPRPSGSACYSATIYRIVTYAHKHEPQCIECHLRIVLHNKGESLRSVAGCCASRTRCSLLPQAQASSSASYSEKKLAISASCSIEPTRSSPRCGMTTGAGPPMPGSLREFQLSGRVAEQ